MDDLFDSDHAAALGERGLTLRDALGAVAALIIGGVVVGGAAFTFILAILAIAAA